MANAFKEEMQRKRDQALMEKCQELIRTGKRIDAIRTFRAATGCSLELAMRALALR